MEFRYKVGIWWRSQHAPKNSLQIINFPLTMLPEPRSVNPQVPGSSPGRGARIRSKPRNPALIRLGFLLFKPSLLGRREAVGAGFSRGWQRVCVAPRGAMPLHAEMEHQLFRHYAGMKYKRTSDGRAHSHESLQTRKRLVKRPHEWSCGHATRD